MHFFWVNFEFCYDFSEFASRGYIAVVSTKDLYAYLLYILDLRLFGCYIKLGNVYCCGGRRSDVQVELDCPYLVSYEAQSVSIFFLF